MTLNRFISSFFILLIFSFYSPANTQVEVSASDQPNIIVIVPDDLGWGDVGYQGSFIRTPNIDKLARTGSRLTQQYVLPTCTPTRVALMTGKYPSRFGVLAPAYGEVIPLEEATLASTLSGIGYETYIDGKWHMGSPPYTPSKYGFDNTYGYFDGQIDPYTHEYKTGRKSWHRNDELLDEEGHATDLITREAVRIVKKEREKPFFLFVTYSVPHFPLNEAQEYISIYDDLSLHPSHQLFAASVTHMDQGIGQILEALQVTGQIENTVVLFISDNGGQHSWQSAVEYHGDYADNPHEVLGNNYPLRGWKGDLYEGGIRVPAIISWPAKLKEGQVDVPIHAADWLPTLLAIIGSEHTLKSKKAMDGENMWPYISKEKKMYENRKMYWKTNSAFAVREGRWKLLVDLVDGNVELYDLSNDFREHIEVSKNNRKVVDRLLSLLEEFKEGDILK